MSSEFGNKIKVSVFGESHGEGIGVVIDGLPSGERVDTERLMEFMSRRKGGKNAFSTQRNETDAPRFLSGLKDGCTTGSPICAIIENKDMRSHDYGNIFDTPRPGHADLTAFLKWQGAADMRGGGHFSGRLTAPLCVAGGIAKEILERRGIFVGAHIDSIAGVKDKPFGDFPDSQLFDIIAKKEFPTIDDEAGERMKAVIAEAKSAEDSVGGVIECAVTGVPAGIGEPMFDGIENKLASAIFGIPAVKGIEFGKGFASTLINGSENNDEYEVRDGKIVPITNNAGGILGGITTGAPIIMRVAIKPTPSISREQKTVNVKTMKEEIITIKGRHDPCIAPRAVPVVEAVAALVILSEIE